MEEQNKVQFEELTEQELDQVAGGTVSSIYQHRGYKQQGHHCPKAAALNDQYIRG